LSAYHRLATCNEFPEADMPSALRAPILAAAAAAVVLLAGCGSSGAPAPGPTGSPAALSKPSASALSGQLVSAIRHATSFHMAGSVENGGRTFYLDLNLTKSGDASGTIALGSPNDAATFLQIGRKVYFKVTRGFVRMSKLPSAACALMCGKWLMESGAAAQSFTGSFTWRSFTRSMVKGPAVAKVSGPVTVDGVQTWKVVKKSSGTFFVAANGTPYPVRALAPHGQGRVDFSKWNSVVIPPPPPAKDVISLSQLSKLG
jgi:hypothetical protein